MPTLELLWTEQPDDFQETALLERLLHGYFGQDHTVVQVIIQPIARGRSGAVPVLAAPKALKAGKPTPLQPEFVKVARSSREIELFRDLAEGTALVFGQQLARSPFQDSDSGYTAFGFRLFEHGNNVGPLYATAHVDTTRACRCVEDLCSRLNAWYGIDGAPDSMKVPLGLDDSHLQVLIQNLAALSSESSAMVKRALAEFQSQSRLGAVSRVHGDLHLENILVPQIGNYSYLTDFGNASHSGSPCIDIARLESDSIYRLLPYDLEPNKVGQFERHLWQGEFASIQEYSAGRVVTTLRREATALRSTNATIWLVVGRILHGLRMLANTWLYLRPYSFESRRKGIAVSLGVLAEVLLSCLAGKLLTILPSANNNSAMHPSEGSRLLRWLHLNRLYDEAFDLAQTLDRAKPKGAAEVPLLGAIAGLSATRLRTAVDLLYQSGSSRARSPFDRGLKNLYLATQQFKAAPPRNLGKTMKLFEKATVLLAAQQDTLYLGIAKDQMARCQQELGDLDAAKISFNDSILAKRQAGDQSGIAISLGGLALLELSTGNYSESLDLLKEDLRLAVAQRDRRAEIKINNWMAQAVLLKDFDLFKSLDHLQTSINKAIWYASQDSTYSPDIDLAFAYVGAGFTHCFLSSVNKVIEYEQAVNRLLPSMRGISGEYVSTLLELMSGQRHCLEGRMSRSSIRCTGALDHLLALSKIDFCDYALRTARFYSFCGHTALAAKIAPKARKMAAELRQSRLYNMLGAHEVVP